MEVWLDGLDGYSQPPFLLLGRCIFKRCCHLNVQLPHLTHKHIVCRVVAGLEVRAQQPVNAPSHGAHGNLPLI